MELIRVYFKVYHDVGSDVYSEAHWFREEQCVKFNSPEFSDLVIYSGGSPPGYFEKQGSKKEYSGLSNLSLDSDKDDVVPIYAHSIKLKRIPVLNKLLGLDDSNNKVNEKHLNLIQRDVLIIILKYIYTNDIEEELVKEGSYEIWSSVLDLSIKWELKELQEISLVFCLSFINCSNATSLYHYCLGVKSMKHIHKLVLKFISDNWDDIVEAEGI